MRVMNEIVLDSKHYAIIRLNIIRSYFRLANAVGDCLKINEWKVNDRKLAGEVLAKYGDVICKVMP